MQVINVLPVLEVMGAIVRIAWAASSGSMELIHSPLEELHAAYEKCSVLNQSILTADWWKYKMTSYALWCFLQDSPLEREDVNACREALDTLTICFTLNPQALETLCKDKMWHAFIIDVLIRCRSRCVTENVQSWVLLLLRLVLIRCRSRLPPCRQIRMSASEQFGMIATKCSSNHRHLIFFNTLLFTVLDSAPREYPKQAHEYFDLICRCVCSSAHSLFQFTSGRWLAPFPVAGC